MFKTRRWNQAISLARDQLPPLARQSMGADHTLTLDLNQDLAVFLSGNPECTRDDPRLNQHNSRRRRNLNPNTGNDLREAETIMQDVAQRRRRVFGSTRPDALRAESTLSEVRLRCARSSNS